MSNNISGGGDGAVIGGRAARWGVMVAATINPDLIADETAAAVEARRVGADRRAT
jgi:hypothetical protein